MFAKQARTRRVLVTAALLASVGASAFIAGAATSGNGEPPVQSRRLAADNSGSFTGCPECHSDLDRGLNDGETRGLLFRHEVHFSKGQADCSMCHSGQTHSRDEVSKPLMVRCFMCHGSSKTAKAPGTCRTCHPPGYERVPSSHLAARWARAGHGAEANDEPMSCRTCHEADTCDACHRTKMPHAKEWKQFSHVESYFDRGPATCTRCHPRPASAPDFCDECHHPDASPKATWTASHISVVKSKGAGDCFDCHDPQTCARCHEEGEDSRSLDGDRAGAIRREKGGSG